MTRWKDVVGFEGRYEVSDDGQVRSLLGRAPRILRPAALKYGHKHVSLRKDGRAYTKTIHILMMQAFVGPPPPGHEVRHLNSDAGDNRLENLRYGTRLENMRDMVKAGNAANGRAGRTHCPRGHEYTEENTRVVDYGDRQARNCRRCDTYHSLKRSKGPDKVTEEMIDERFAKRGLSG